VESSACTSHQERAKPKAADPEGKNDRCPADHHGSRASALHRSYGDADEEDGEQKKQRTEDTTLSGHGRDSTAREGASTIAEPNLGA
jgi:hypothetical protein